MLVVKYCIPAQKQRHNGEDKGGTIIRAPNHPKGGKSLREPQNGCGGRRKVPTMSQVLSSIQYCTFTSERPQFRTWGCQTCFLPRAPSNLVTPLLRRLCPAEVNTCVYRESWTPIRVWYVSSPLLSLNNIFHFLVPTHGLHFCRCLPHRVVSFRMRQMTLQLVWPSNTPPRIRAVACRGGANGATAAGIQGRGVSKDLNYKK